MSRSRLGGPTQRATLTPTPPPHAPPLEVGMGPTSLAVGLIDYIIAIADDPAQAKRLVQTDFMKQVPLKLKHEAELWERLQRDIEWLKRERAKEAAAAKDAVANAMAAAEELHKVKREKAAAETAAEEEIMRIKRTAKSSAAEELRKVMEEKESLEADLKKLAREKAAAEAAAAQDVQKADKLRYAAEAEIKNLRASLKESQAANEALKSVQAELQSRLEEQGLEADRRVEEVKLQLDKAQAQQSAVEKQLSEARAKFAEGSTAKEAEGDRLMKELEDARATAAQLEAELSESKASSARREASLEASVTRLKRSEATLQEEVATVKAQLATSEEALAATAELVEQLQQQEGEWKQEISRLTNAEQGMAQELEAVRAKSDRAAQERSSGQQYMEEMMRAKEEEVAQLQEQLKRAEEEYAEEVGRMEEAMEELTARANEGNNEITLLREQVLNEEAARHELGEELQRKEEVVSHQEMKINNLTAELESLTSQLGQSGKEEREELGRTKAELLQVSTQARQLQSQVDGLSSQVTALNRENLHLRTVEAELVLRLRELEERTKVLTPTSLNNNNYLSSGEQADAGLPPGLVLVVETGMYRMRFGVVDVTNAGEIRGDVFSVPSLVARPASARADVMSIVKNAGMQASPMYNKFRDQGIFVGRDAWYCTFEHPDPSLRSALRLDSPFHRGALERPDDLRELWISIFDMLQVDPSEVSVLMTYKPTTSLADKEKIAMLLFEECFVSRVRFVNEAFLLSSWASAPTSLIVDIGEDTTRVVPVYEQLVVDVAIKTAPVGGADLTKYMADMLHSCKDEQYSSLVPRKQLDLARRVKEKHSYVARDFDAQVEKLGKFGREKVDVMKAMRGYGESQPTLAEPQRPEDLVVYDHMTQDGRDVNLTVGRERFHCPELLFRPELFEGSEHTCSLTDVIMESLKSVEHDFWEDLLKNIIVGGHTALIPGLLDRLTLELKKRLPPKFANYVRMVPGEARTPAGEEESTAVWRGAATHACSVQEEDWLTTEVYQILSASGAAAEIKYWV